MCWMWFGTAQFIIIIVASTCHCRQLWVSGCWGGGCTGAAVVMWLSAIVIVFVAVVVVIAMKSMHPHMSWA